MQLYDTTHYEVRGTEFTPEQKKAKVADLLKTHPSFWGTVNQPATIATIGFCYAVGLLA